MHNCGRAAHRNPKNCELVPGRTLRRIGVIAGKHAQTWTELGVPHGIFFGELPTAFYKQLTRTAQPLCWLRIKSFRTHCRQSLHERLAVFGKRTAHKKGFRLSGRELFVCLKCLNPLTP